MHPHKTSIHFWLSLRIRLLCAVVFAASMFLPPYVPDSSTAPLPETERAYQGSMLAEEGFLMKTSALTEQGTRSAFTKGIIHTVEPGENVDGIAKTAFLQPETIRWANNLSDNATVKTGQKLLLLPVDGVMHTVKRGQNLQTIADLYGVNAATLASQNNIKGGYLLAGQELIVPGGKPIVEAPPAPVIAAKPVTKPAPAVASITKINAPEMKNFAIEPSYGVFQMPCDCYYTQYYSKSHFAVDMQHKGGSPNFAAEAGTVIRADSGWNGGYGNVIEIDHGNGLITLYAHNKTFYVKKGDTVTRGQPIAFMGNTGRVHGPTGIHLHFEVHVNGVKKNPMVYLQQ